jgi:hypothetical protein
MPNEVAVLFKIHTKDGITSRVDLSNAERAIHWIQRLKEDSFQNNITGVSVLRKCEGQFRCPSCNKKIQQSSCRLCGRSHHETVCGTNVQYSLSKPIGFQNVFYYVEHIEPDVKSRSHGGERITCFADGVKIVVMVHANQSAARITLTKTGKQIYNPLRDG